MLRRLLLPLLLFLTACGYNHTPAYETIHGVVWGTPYTVTWKPGDPSVDVPALVTAVLDRVDSAANAFNPAAEIARFNAEGRLDHPSATFLCLLDASKRLNKASNGAFEPTIAPLVDIWGFGAGDSIPEPTQADIEQALGRVGIDLIEVSDTAVTASVAGVRLDLAAIAKGYAVQAVADALSDAGIADYMVEIGGEIVLAGCNPHGCDWAIQIDAPVPDQTGTHTALDVVSTTDCAIATSGNYRNFRRTADGRLVSHTISPLTGAPADSDILSATVVARDCATADALATACMVLRLEQSRQMIAAARADSALGLLYAIIVTAGDAPDTYTLIKI